jgi:glucose dehydrogenase
MDLDYMAIEPEEEILYKDIGPLATENRHTLQEEAPSVGVSDDMLENDVNRADRWLTYNKGIEQWGYSPADRLTPFNVDSLDEAWVIETESEGLQVNPVVVPSEPPVLYYTTTNGKVVAVNARTGEEFWEFQFGYPEDPDFYFAPRSRGVAVYGDKVYAGTGTMHLFALDAATGEQVWDTDIKTQEQYDEMQYEWKGYGITHAPIVYENTVIAGQCGGDGSPEGWTHLRAFDAETGEEVWTTEKYGPEDQWVDETWRFSNNSPWMTAAIDKQTRTVYTCAGNPGPMLNGLVRPGPNQYGAGIVAIDFDTGETKWNMQYATGDIWDYDGQFTPHVMDMEVNGEIRRVVVAAHKTGWTFVHDAETGQLYERSRPFAQQGGHFLKWLPMGEQNAVPVWPQTGGGTPWCVESFSPETGHQYIGYVDGGNKLWMEEYEFDPEDGLHEDAPIGGGTASLDNTGSENVNQGGVRALDLDTGEIAWTYEYTRGVDNEWSAGRAESGGVTATGGNLVFAATPTGNMVALDAEDGELVWLGDTGVNAQLPTGPVVWDDPTEGRQYVSLAANDRIVTWASSGRPV